MISQDIIVGLIICHQLDVGGDSRDRVRHGQKPLGVEVCGERHGVCAYYLCMSFHVIVSNMARRIPTWLWYVSH
jgi:hypothetical protein